MPKISVVLITFNEEKNLPATLQAVSPVADEIVILDSFSSDSTRQIAERFGAKFFQQVFDGYGKQKNDALRLAQNDWILSIDADEVLTPQLQNELMQFKNSAASASAFRIGRRNHYCGKFIRHCGWYPDKAVRLFDRRFFCWSSSLVHEVVIPCSDEASSRIGELTGELNHYTYSSVENHKSKALHFAAQAAREKQSKGKSPSFCLACVKAAARFFRTYFLKLGFLDGYFGFVISQMAAVYAFHKYYWVK